MILILSNSVDVTTDLMLPHLQERADVFRFNMDLWRDYQWNIHAHGFELQDPVGRVCTEQLTGAVYERKVMFNPPRIDEPAGGSQEAWLRSEVQMIWSSLKDWAFHEGKLAVIHPSPSGTWYKWRQMRHAARYFRVPEWQMLHGTPVTLSAPVVCKTNGVTPVGNGTVLTVNKVDPAAVDVAYPWFLQQMEAEASADVTVAYIAGKLFASEFSRTDMRGVDSRTSSLEHPERWVPCELSADEQCRIVEMMRETGLSFARLDFLRTPKGLVFLEFNPNGQFAWLDIKNERGLFTCIADEVWRVHQQHLS
ncbi:MAG: hypothetical protein IKV82_03995 [Akkermansia sp.]|nr:hypothetical protein [Akkermansia sp.]